MTYFEEHGKTMVITTKDIISGLTDHIVQRIPLYTDVSTTESEACDALIKKISSGEKIYQEKMMRK